MPTCAAYGCTQCKKTAEATLHVFPKDPDLRRKWIAAVRRKDFVPSQRAVLCTRHFREEDVDRTSATTLRLRENAVPSVFLAFPPHLQKSKKSRKPPRERKPLLNVSALSNENSSTCVIQPSNVQTDMECQTSNKRETSVVGLVTDDCSSHSSEQVTKPICELLTNSNSDCSALDTPRKVALKRKLNCLQQRLTVSRKKIKVLQQAKRRVVKRNANLSNEIAELRKKNSIGCDSLQILEKTAGGVGDLLTRMVKKQSNIPLSSSYSAELRSFALTLHFYSPQAYRYVRKVFNTCLPHPRTIEKWYSSVDGQPGFTSHAFEALKARSMSKQS